ncbi:MAG TPA: hypothetical protein VFU49_24815 [Ktedonobacteraceae bacterium]|nr:hypothetical protein [Ktedonobacteraceae bacterium]
MKLRPSTIAALATHIEKGGCLAMAIIREQPDLADELIYNLFHAIANSFYQALDAPDTQLKDCKAYAEFLLSWDRASQLVLRDRG